MKKIFKILPLLLIAVLGAALSSCGDDKDDPIPSSQLPSKATEFISQYFPSAKIISSFKDKDEFEVKLSEGTQIEFNKDGEWIDVEAPSGKTIPSGFYPSEIDTYLSQYFEGQGISEITKVKRGYEVELITTTEILFGPDGSFIEIGIDR